MLTKNVTTVNVSVGATYGKVLDAVDPSVKGDRNFLRILNVGEEVQLIYDDSVATEAAEAAEQADTTPVTSTASGATSGIIQLANVPVVPGTVVLSCTTTAGVETLLYDGGDGFLYTKPNKGGFRLAKLGSQALIDYAAGTIQVLPVTALGLENGKQVYVAYDAEATPDGATIGAALANGGSENFNGLGYNGRLWAKTTSGNPGTLVVATGFGSFRTF